MIPIVAHGLPGGRHQALLAEAERHRLIAALPAGPGTLQRFALQATGRGQQPAVAPRPAALLPRSYRPSAI